MDFILRNNETNQLQYHYASRNNNQAFDEPFLITTRADLEQLRQALTNLDVLTWAQQLRPNSKWIIDLITNMTFFVTKLRGHPIGRGKSLPHYIVENRGIISLDRSAQTGIQYQDNLCFFRAMALHHGFHAKNLETETKKCFQRY